MVPSNAPETPNAGPEPSDSNRQTTVLVVDDAPVDRVMTGAIIEQMPGWRALYAESGEEALAAIAREQPRIILTDLNMPKMDGLELLAAVKQSPDWTRLPVVMITTEAGEGHVVQALSSGARGYIRKPFSPDQIRERIIPLLQG